MTANIYNSLIGYRETGGNLQDRLAALSVLDIFAPVYGAYDQDIANRILFYILDVYSLESPTLIMGGDWRGIKEAAFKRNGLLPEMERRVVFPSDEVIVKAIRAYVDYQKAPTFRHYCMLQDLYGQFLDLALTGKDVEHKMRAQRYAKDLLPEIDQFRKMIKEEFHLLDKAEKELPVSEPKKVFIGTSLTLEDNLPAEKEEVEEDEL